MTELKMPSLGADMDAGTVLEWFIEPGTNMTRGDTIAVIDTDKAEVEIETFHGGLVSEIVVPVGVTVPVGAVLARYEPSDAATAGDGVHAASQPTMREAGVTDTPLPPEVPLLEPAVTQQRESRAPSSAFGLDHSATPAELSRGRPTGAIGSPRPSIREHTDGDKGLAGGPIVKPDAVDADSSKSAVVAASLAGRPKSGHRTTTRPSTGIPSSSPAPSSRKKESSREIEKDAVPTSGTRAEKRRRQIAAQMSRSKREIPHYYVSDEIDVTPLVTWLTEQNEARAIDERILPAAALAKAVARAAADVPGLSGVYTDNRFNQAASVHLGIAVSLRDGGIVAPAIHDANKLTLPDFMAALRDMVRRARGGGLRWAEMADATITLTNLGEQGVRSVQGIINPPQVAMVGLGRIAERPAVVDGHVVVRQMVTASLAADHRVTDGLTGARFLRKLNRLVQAPETL